VSPRKSDPVIYPHTTVQAGIGDTSISSTVFMNFNWKKENAIFWNDPFSIAIITSPGTINAIYDTPPTSLICEPIKVPKIRK
jgi:hypothetical protein